MLFKVEKTLPRASVHQMEEEFLVTSWPGLEREVIWPVQMPMTKTVLDRYFILAWEVGEWCNYWDTKDYFMYLIRDPDQISFLN